MNLQTFQVEFDLARKNLHNAANGLDSCSRLTQVVDKAIISILEECCNESGIQPDFALIATGGHGRRELAPFSDLDLAVLLIEELNPEQDKLVRRVYAQINSMFQDKLKLKVDFGLRAANEVFGQDGVTRTSLIDVRFLGGSYQAFDRYFQTYWREFPIADFLLDRIAERQKQMSSSNMSLYSTAPDLKNGAGGLRSLHAANWIRLPLDYQRLNRSENYSWLIGLRNRLHQVAGKKFDQLTPQYQEILAREYGISIQELMNQVYPALEELEYAYQDSLRLIKESRFKIRTGVDTRLGQVEVEPNSSAGSVAMGLALAQELGLKTPLKMASFNEDFDGDSILKALSLNENSFETMISTGFIDKILPDLANSKYTLQPGTGHDWTVYEHSLRVAKNLLSLEKDEGWKGQVYHLSGLKSELILAAILHDIAKPIDLENHAILGAQKSEEISKQWNLEPFTQNMISWLIENHLEMSKTIRFRDVSLPVTHEVFAASIPTARHLAGLTLLTFADMAAVNGETYTPITDSFLQELYRKTMALFALDSEEAAMNFPINNEFIALEDTSQETKDQITEMMNLLPASYLLSTRLDQAAVHSNLIQKVRETHLPEFHFKRVLENGTTEFSVCTEDKSGLLSQILGTLYAYDISIISLKAVTTSEPTPIAIDVFSIAYDGKPLPAATIRLVDQKLRKIMDGSLILEDLLSQKGKDPNRTEKEFSYAFHPGNLAIIEFRAKRGRGLAFRFSKKLTELGWNIAGARVSQWGAMGAASFYVQTLDQTPLDAKTVEQAFTPKVH